MTAALKQMPELPFELLFIWEVFATLSKSRGRSLQFGTEGRQYITPDPIAVSEILALTNGLGVVDIEQRFRVLRLVQRMDDVYLDRANARVK